MTEGQEKEYLPEGKKIRRQLKRMLATVGPRDSLIVALAGHGVQFKGEKGSYFCPVDAELARRNTLIGLNDLYRNLKACKAERKLLLVDASHGDPLSSLAKSSAEFELNPLSNPAREPVPAGVAALFSCSNGERSFEDPGLKHGVFFYHVLKGWKGAAANENGWITLSGLAEYVTDQTSRYARLHLQARQRPELKGGFGATWVLRELNDPLNDRVQEALVKKDPDRVIRQCSQAIRRNPKHARAHYNLGVALTAKGDLTGAIAAYRKSIALDPKDNMAYSNLGSAMQAQQNLKGAVAAYRQAIKLNPNYATAYNNLGSALIAQEDLEGAVAACRQAINLNPKYAQAHNNLGWAYFNKKQYDQALAYYTEALQINSDLAEANVGRGDIYLETKKYLLALAEYTKAIRLRPKQAELYLKRSRVYQALGQAQKAKTDFEIYRNLKPGQ
jgi:tetratricopeptide (TPR) repeat protein